MFDINDVLTRGVEKVYPTKEGLASLMRKEKITLYQGFDPSMPSLHLGNFVGLMKLRSFQKLGHKIIFLVGDFTGMIGDPTDKLATRKKLTRKEVLANAKSWKEQAEKVIDFTGQNKAKIMFNSEWSDKITFKDLIEITSNLTVQQLLERDMFQVRIKEEKPIYLHEFLYPVAQGYDSIAMDVDLEIGGSDQIFNMLVGRTLMKAIKGKEKYVLATKLLVDKDGNKVGKTTGNALFLDSSPEEFYGGIMSFPDDVLELSFEILTEMPLGGLSKKIKDDPMESKKLLAFEIVRFLWGSDAAKKSENSFKNTFQNSGTPDDIRIVMINEKVLPLLDLVFTTKSVSSRSEAKRLISQNAVEIDGKVVSNPQEEIDIPKKGVIIKIGKKTFVKIHQD
jgi:tyrosyl-tRNA synthetase